MSDTWFKHWAREHLLSDDLDALTDHEERIWWRLLSATSLEEQRWSTEVTPRLAAKCKSTPLRFARALARMVELGMVVREGDRVQIANAVRWNEMARSRVPSAEPEAVRERVRRHRELKRAAAANEGDDVSPAGVTRFGNGHKEEEGEKRREEAEQWREPIPFEEPPGFRERLGEMVTANPRIRRDETLYSEAAQIATDYSHEQIRAAIRSQRNAKDAQGRPMGPFPSNWRRFLIADPDRSESVAGKPVELWHAGPAEA